MYNIYVREAICAVNLHTSTVPHATSKLSVNGHFCPLLAYKIMSIYFNHPYEKKPQQTTPNYGYHVTLNGPSCGSEKKVEQQKIWYLTKCHRFGLTDIFNEHTWPPLDIWITVTFRTQTLIAIQKKGGVGENCVVHTHTFTTHMNIIIPNLKSLH